MVGEGLYQESLAQTVSSVQICVHVCFLFYLFYLDDLNWLADKKIRRFEFSFHSSWGSEALGSRILKKSYICNL